MKKPNKIFNNIGLKILAVIFSVLLWLVSVNINDPVDTEVYRNIPVELENTSLLTEEGLTYQVLDDTDRVTVTVRASRSVLENINASDVTATADFSELSFTNTVPIRLSLSRAFGSQIEISGNIDMVRLEVEERQEKQLVIEIDQVGTPADGYCKQRADNGRKRPADFRTAVAGVPGGPRCGGSQCGRPDRKHQYYGTDPAL